MKYMKSAHRVLENISELVMVLIDFSPSMDYEDYAPSRKEGAILANSRMIEVKARRYPQDKMGIIAFDESAYILHHPINLRQGQNSLCKSLRKNIADQGGTNFTAALNLARQCLFNQAGARESDGGLLRQLLGSLMFEDTARACRHIRELDNNCNITRRIILLTDGEHNGDGCPAKVAQRLKNAGVIIECIGIAGSSRQVNEKMLKKIASRDENGKPRYCFIGDTEKLIRKYQSMAHHIRPV